MFQNSWYLNEQQDILTKKAGDLESYVTYNVEIHG
jgi:hypothetical protein